MRKGDWMQTFSGRQYWPLDPRVGEVYIGDIAAALARQCRYGGHCRNFYSVAEHCVHVALYLKAQGHDRETCFAGLMHDASEAYVVDIIRPLKPHLANYAEVENLNMTVIAERFGFAWPMPAIVKEVDNRILLDEQAQNMAPPPAPWGVSGEPLGITLAFCEPSDAERRFLRAFDFFSVG